MMRIRMKEQYLLENYARESSEQCLCMWREMELLQFRENREMADEEYEREREKRAREQCTRYVCMYWMLETNYECSVYCIQAVVAVSAIRMPSI